MSEQQLEVKEEILKFCKTKITETGHHVFIVEGDAGTGKSVLLSSLFNTIQDLTKEADSALYQTDNYLLVNHGEMLKTYKSIAGSLPNLKKKQFQKPTPFLNTLDKQKRTADIVLVDEAHLLLTKEDVYNNFHQQNQLHEIITRSKITILIFDPKQVLKIKSHWGHTTLQDIVGPFSTKMLQLSNQFRMQASQQTLHWINRFVERELLPIPSDLNYDLQIFEDPEVFKQAIFSKNEQHGLSRIVSTFDYLLELPPPTLYLEVKDS
ncbi:DNA/RNA helicase domain-containing protein [Exiguobacterium sp. S22-S28]|uniref:DNA/RNA helicase domain-containing protein n=1 Tax=Exiguobacterium sp. S22-S28 TaxID=3342768 RepID=UPI00372CE791